MPATAKASRSTSRSKRLAAAAARVASAPTGSPTGGPPGPRVVLGHLLRWVLTLLGGTLVGAGLVLHGQVALAHVMREEVEHTFFLWRAVGETTIFLQGGDVRFAFALREIPAEVLRECDIAAWTLVAVGLLMALTGLLLPTPQRRP